MLTLYQFPISHYCEKVRWALAYKRLPYRTKNLLPGLHALKTKALAPASSVPILQHGGKVMQQSAAIVSYLDAAFPERPLTPSDGASRDEALAWEAFADEEIGIAIRKVSYHILLAHPEILVPLFTRNAPWYGRLYMKAMFPSLVLRMRENMGINARTAAAAQRQLANAVDTVHARLQERPFLAGDSFTRADLATAALLAPLCKRPEYGVVWPARFPEPLEALAAQYADKLAFVHRLYDGFR